MTRIATATAWLLLAGCTASPLEEPVGEARAFISVEEAVTAGCSTSQIEALSRQIIAQGNCNEPGAFSELVPPANVNFGSAVLPYLDEPARDKLLEALTENPSLDMQVNSMLRTVAQQYLLYQWYLGSMCGIALAATPGSSNHETGLAIDIQQYDDWRTILEAKDFTWLGAGDPVHFDYTGPDAVDHRGLDVLSFQQLHNLNNPTDLIDEDGLYGPQTEARIQVAPAEGFPEGPTCGTPGDGELSLSAMFEDADAFFNDGPSAGVVDLYEGQTYELTITAENTGVAPLTGVTVDIIGDDYLTVDETSVDLGDIPTGATIDATITVTAAAYSVESEATASIDLSADTATTTIEADVYSQIRWEWNGARLEGWRPSSGGNIELGDGTLVVEAGTAAISPTINVTSVRSVEIVGSSAEPATLVVQTESGEDVFNIDPFDGTTQIAAEVSGDITSLRIDTAGTMTLDAVRLRSEAVDPAPPVEESGCSCRTAGGAPPPRAAWLLVLAAALLRRRRSLH